MEYVAATSRDPKVGRGIGLRPGLWARIDAYAEHRQRTRNQIIEDILDANVPQIEEVKAGTRATGTGPETEKAGERPERSPATDLRRSI